MIISETKRATNMYIWYMYIYIHVSITILMRWDYDIWLMRSSFIFLFHSFWRLRQRGHFRAQGLHGAWGLAFRLGFKRPAGLSSHVFPVLFQTDSLWQLILTFKTRFCTLNWFTKNHLKHIWSYHEQNQIMGRVPVVLYNWTAAKVPCRLGDAEIHSNVSEK